MQHTIDWQGRRVVVTTAGVAERSGFTRFIDAILADERFVAGTSVLVDHSALDMSHLTTADMQALAAVVVGRNARIGRLPVALVAPASVSYGLSRQFVAYADEAELEVHVFTSRSEAEAWLEARAA